MGIKPIGIYPGSSWGESGKKSLHWSDFMSNESARVNVTISREVLNTEWYGTTRQTQAVINQLLK
jgi:hypothetical protein